MGSATNNKAGAYSFAKGRQIDDSRGSYADAGLLGSAGSAERHK